MDGLEKGTKGQRDIGTKDQRDKGTKGQWDKGTIWDNMGVHQEI